MGSWSKLKERVRGIEGYRLKVMVAPMERWESLSGVCASLERREILNEIPGQARNDSKEVRNDNKMVWDDNEGEG